MIYANHFIYRDQDSRDYSLTICSLDGQSLESVDSVVLKHATGNNISQLTKSVNTVYYDDVLSFPVQFIKDDQSYFTHKQTEEILQWLAETHYDWLSFYNEEEMEVCFYCCPTKVTQKKYGGVVYGFEVTFETNSPYGWSPVIENSFSITENNQNEYIYVDTNNFEYVYPYIEITKNGAGDIIIHNNDDIDELTNETFNALINNCITGEKIIYDCFNKIILSDDKVHHKYFVDDFNFKYLRLKKGMNELQITGNCDFSYKFRIPIKVGEW